MAVIEVTTKIGCSIRCRYCPQNTFIRKYRERSNIYAMTFDMYKTCVDKLPAEVDVVFAGMSEPFLNKEATRMVLYAHERGHKVCVNTTLVGMQISDYELIKNVPFKYFCIHLPSEGGNENIAINDDYLELLNTITKSGMNVLCHSHGGAVNPKVIPYVNKPIRKAYISSRASNIAVNERGASSNNLQGAITCARDFSWNVLLPNGDVLVCSSDYGMQHVLGNLLDTDYDSLFQGEPFKQLKADLSKNSSDTLCRSCTVYAFKTDIFSRISYYCVRSLLRRIHESRFNPFS